MKRSNNLWVAALASLLLLGYLGLSSSRIRFALDSQNLLSYHNQERISITYASEFGCSPSGKFNGWLLPKTGSIPNLVTRDTHAIFANLEFAY